MGRRRLSPLVVLLLPPSMLAPCVFGGSPALIAGDLRLVPRNGVAARASVVPASDGEGRVLRVEFEKTDDVRRMVAVSGSVAPGLAEARVVELDGDLQLTEGEAPRVCAVLFGRHGERWIRKGVTVEAGGGRRSWPVSIARMQPAAFTEAEVGVVAWPDVERVWVGLVFGGPARGRWDVRAIRFTDGSPPGLLPAALMHAGATGWQLHHDASVKATLATVEGGPEGQSAMRVNYSFPGGRHMFCTCSLPVSAEQPELYRAVRLTYRASLPPGIDGLLFILAESGGACYLADPAPGPSAEWRTLDVPYAAFRLASWTPDPNSRLDPETLTTVWVGTHGKASEDGGPGWIEVAAIELVP